MADTGVLSLVLICADPRRQAGLGVSRGALSVAVAGVATPGLAAFAGGDDRDDQRHDGVGPAPAEPRVGNQSDEQDGGQVRAQQGLDRVGDHGAAAQFAPRAALGPAEHRHHEQGHRGQGDPDRAGAGVRADDQGVDGIDGARPSARQGSSPSRFLTIQPTLYRQGMLAAPDRLDALQRVGRAMADPTRCRLLLVLLDGPAYPAQMSNLLGLTRANVSNHLACLRGCGLVTTTSEGRQVRYELADAALACALRDLADLVLDVDADLDCLPIDRSVPTPVMAR